MTRVAWTSRDRAPLDRRRSRRLPSRAGRRGLVLAVLLSVLLLVSGCGDGDGLPALAANEAPRIRVLLRRTTAELRVEGQSWELRSESGQPYARRGSFELRAPLRASSRGIALGSEETGATVLRLRTERSFSLDGVGYAGDLILRADGAKLRFINEVDMETYVAGVIPNEMAPGASPGAYRAQAVAARTYAWMRLGAGGTGDGSFHVYDTQSSQVYTGITPRYDVSYDEMVRRTAETRGVILTWENRPFHTYYSSTCGGHTTDPETSQLEPGAETGPLRGVRCEFCTTSPKYQWSSDHAEQDIVDGLARRRRPVLAPIHAISVTERGPGGWAREVAIVYGPDRKVRKLPGTEFRSALRLLSHRIASIEKTRGRWIVAGYGWGHGVGMCQWGALEMAKRGASESEILRWYYPGAEFTKVY
ncbi:MAG: SpoIID/LytB domain-containing protein [Planctomycetota bacterium]|jgi:stage II sporulation protein D